MPVYAPGVLPSANAMLSDSRLQNSAYPSFGGNRQAARYGPIDPRFHNTMEPKARLGMLADRPEYAALIWTLEDQRSEVQDWAGKRKKGLQRKTWSPDDERDYKNQLALYDKLLRRAYKEVPRDVLDRRRKQVQYEAVPTHDELLLFGQESSERPYQGGE